MNSTAATNWLTFAGILLALAAIIYQNIANGKQLRLQNFSDYTKRYQEIILHFPESINEATFALEKLPDADVRNTTLRYMRAYFDLCFEEFTLADRKIIDKAVWAVWKEGIQFALSKPAFRESWAIVKRDTRYGDAFVAFVDSHTAIPT